MNEDKIRHLFGLHVKKIRLERGLSQEELAQLSDLEQNIHKWH